LEHEVFYLPHSPSKHSPKLANEVRKRCAVDAVSSFFCIFTGAKLRFMLFSCYFLLFLHHFVAADHREAALRLRNG
jgi:hypothetical protein